MKGSKSKSAIVVPLLFLIVASCTHSTSQTLVFGERTGLNISVNVDPAKAAPLELNTGFRRQVVGVVPPSQSNANGEPVGEAANMISHFELQQQQDANGNALNKDLSMRGAFVSGAAATELVGRNDSAVVNTVINKVAERQIVTTTAPSNPQDIDVSKALVAFINVDPDVNAARYLELAQKEGLIITPHPLPQISAGLTAQDGRNTSGNQRIARQLFAS